jgi:hypothetical protein
MTLAQKIRLEVFKVHIVSLKARRVMAETYGKHHDNMAIEVTLLTAQIETLEHEEAKLK